MGDSGEELTLVPSGSGERCEAAVTEPTQENGRQINGRQINGRQINGATVTGAAIAGVAADAVSLDGTVLTAVVGGATYRAEELVGAKLDVLVTEEDGSRSSISLEVTQVENSPDPAVYTYTLESAEGAAVCPYGAIPVLNHWEEDGSYDPTRADITFSCREVGAVAKCIDMGYHYWKPEFATYHTSCVRMIRADYCHSGVSYTTDGQEVNVWDTLSPAIQCDATRWPVEAEWNESGALCVSKSLYKRFVSAGSVPPCFDDGLHDGLDDSRWTVPVTDDCGVKLHMATKHVSELESL